MSITGWMSDYIARQAKLLLSVDLETVAAIVQVLKVAHEHSRNVFVFGNGGNAASASHFATDLGKGASDKLKVPFKVMSLNDNVPWLTALGNDYCYGDVFVRQLMNFGQSGDVVISSSVSGNSENLVRALEWSRRNGMTTVAIVGSRQGRMVQHADHILVIDETHYGRVEDVQMTIYHMLCYAFMELPQH